jgi:hypothetical protein
MTDFSEPTTATGSTWIRCFSADGYQMALTLPITSVADALRHLADIRAAGLTATLSVAGGLESGEQAKSITMAVKRMKKNRTGETRPVMDVYSDGDEFKFVTIYLDTDEQVSEFEQHSGLRVSTMPKYPSTAPLNAGTEETREFEVRVKTPFIVVRKPAPKEVIINDQPVRPWDFVRYGTLAVQAPQSDAKQTPPPPAQTAPDGTGFTPDTARDFVAHWFQTAMLEVGDMLTALDIKAFGEWKQTVADAHARVARWVQAREKAKGSAPTGASPLAANARHRH